MITASFYDNKDTGTITMAVSGHAGAAKKGEDIVCSAVSVLAYTAAQTIQYMYDQGSLLEEPKINLDDGECLVKVRPKQESYEEAMHTFFVVQVGFRLLSNSYPQYVEVEPFYVG